MNILSISQIRHNRSRHSASRGLALLPVLLLGLLFNACAMAATPTYTFAVTPQFEQRKLIAIWMPIVAEVEKRTGLSLKLTSMMSIPEFEKQLAKSTFDFVYCNPYNIIKSVPDPGYIPLVRDGSPMRGIVLVRKDSAYKKLSDLEHKTVAFPSPNAIGASLLVRADLARLHHVTINPMYVKTHSSVYLHVVNGLADAGGGVETTLQEQDAAIRDALRILYTTREFPSLPVAANPRVPKADREKVRQALLELSATPEGKEMFARVPMKQVVPTSPDDYAPMRAWGLESFWIDKY
ncbi:MAG: phosphate/phosphite/phosphonate ABC transporter substrate-binding protein [Nitrosomonadales bacterium]|nr:phosphate/phosphite/phosphonate ABC transporter substrate-binding protein [Nitrosomonadales bacterium]